MAEKEDFVDITPRAGGMREVFLSEQDYDIINDNPRGLTKEGCMVKVWQWYQSQNATMQMRYLAMYKACKNFAKSGSLEDGNIILSRRTTTDNKGITKTFITKEKIGQKNKLGDTIIMDSVEELKRFVESKLVNLRFITKKGAM
jgi:hypothetical protein